MTEFPITALYAAACLVIAIALQVWIIRARNEHKVGVGDGGNDALIRRMRSQANFVETAPILLIALALLEAGAWPVWLLHLFGITLIVSRTVHPIGMTNRYPDLPLRVGSTVATLVLHAVAALLLILQVL